MFECFHCGHKTVVWQSDFSFEDMMYEGEGIVHICTCSHCGAEIEYRVPIKEEEKKDTKTVDMGSLSPQEKEDIWKDMG